MSGSGGYTQIIPVSADDLAALSLPSDTSPVSLSAGACLIYEIR